jgi:hypothetical protein
MKPTKSMKPNRSWRWISLAVLGSASAVACEPAPPDIQIAGSAGTAPLAATTTARTRGNRVEAVDRDYPADATVMLNPNRRAWVPDARGERIARVSNHSFSDWSEKVFTKIWMCSNAHAPASHPVVQCSVDADYVLVGGGAWANATGAGALLTASFPQDPAMLTTWEGRSKDHAVSDPHVLFVFAIGLRIANVQATDLRGLMFVNQTTSAPAAHPEATAPGFQGGEDNEILTIGGGCRVNWDGVGNMLTWIGEGSCASKDHGWSSPASVTAYGIGIPRNVPGLGELGKRYAHAGSSPVAQGRAEARTTIPDGAVPTMLMGFSNGQPTAGPGRMLTRVSPELTGRVIVGESKDHGWPDDGTVTISAILLSKRD